MLCYCLGDREFGFFYRDGPLLVVASGRDTISVSSSIKRLAPDTVFVVQVVLHSLSILWLKLIEILFVCLFVKTG